MERYKKEFKEISTRQITMDIPNDFIYHIENVLSKMNNIDTINAFDQIVKSLNDTISNWHFQLRKFDKNGDSVIVIE